MSRGDIRFEHNIEDYWNYAKARDLMLAHAFATVRASPALPGSTEMIPKIVERNSDGVIVSGVKTVATYAVHADELFIGTPPLTGITEDQAIYFAIPIATPGIRIVARTPFAVGRDFDHPGGRFGDENDCIVIFDRVLVPWDRVFRLGDPGSCVRVFWEFGGWAHWDILARLAVKAEVLVGLYALLPEITARNDLPECRRAIAETVRYLITIRAFLEAAEANGSVTPSARH